jgi:RHS repeat-associated protein
MVEKDNVSVTSDRRYVWCGVELCEERDSTGSTVLKRFVDQGLRVENGSDPPMGNYFFTRDHLGSIREMTDASGATRAQYAYSPFGLRQHLAGNLEADFGFTGHYFHAQTKLHLAPFRAYDASFARWLSRDPLGEEGGLNLYEYVAVDPVNRVDFLGMDSALINGYGMGFSKVVNGRTYRGMSGASIDAQILHEQALSLRAPRTLNPVIIILSSPLFYPLWDYLGKKLVPEPQAWDPNEGDAVCSQEIEDAKADRRLRQQVARGIGYDPNKAFTDDQWRVFNPLYERAKSRGYYSGEGISW